MGFHLAVDGGNSKTVAVVVDDTGTVHGRGRAGCCDIYATADPASGVAEVVSATTRAVHEAGDPELGAAVFRLASCDWPEDLRWWDDQLRAQLPSIGRLGPAALQVGNDALSSLRLGDPTGVGVSAVVGTGPAVGARNTDGREAWSGVWIFDSMAGIGLCDAAMAAVCKAWLGIAPQTALTPALLTLFDEPDVWHLNHGFRRRFGAREPNELRHATRTVMRVAADGDPVARQLVADQGRLFADYAGAFAGQAGIGARDGLPVVLNGSIATSELGVVREALISALAERFPESRIVVAEAPPLAGVTLDVLAAAGVDLTDRLRERVAATVHPEHFLTT